MPGPIPNVSGETSQEKDPQIDKPPEPKPLQIKITGRTEFHLGNPSKAIAGDIAIGYKKANVPNDPSILHASITASDNKSITLQNLIDACTDQPVEIPDFLNAIAFKRFSVSYGSDAANTSEYKIQFECLLTIGQNAFDTTLCIDYKKINDKPIFSFGGILTVDGLTFTITCSKSEDTWLLYAGVQNPGKTTLSLRSIAEKLFSPETAANLPDLSIEIDGFKAFLLYKKPATGDKALLFGMGAGIKLDLKDLPLAGEILSQGQNFAFQELLAMYSSGAFDKKTLSGIDGIPRTDITPGFNLSAKMLMNGITEYYVLNAGAGKNATPEKKPPQSPPQAPPQSPPHSASGTLAPIQPLDGSVSSAASWKKVDKHIGPITLERLGFLFKDGRIIVLLDASMEMAGLGMQLMGFGLGFRLKWPPEAPAFYIDGIGISYNIPPIEIAGAFLHTTEQVSTNGHDTTVDVYTGAAILKICWFSISAIGSYAKVPDKDGNEVASLFIYGVFLGTIGGPVFFILTGIAVGFGYNRRVNVPSIEEVAMFPLVALAMQTDDNKDGLMGVLKKLETPMKNGKKPISISVGDYWLALGIRFSSFKLLDTFVLVTVNFGVSGVEFIILGLSRLSWPEKTISKGVDPIVYIELAIMIHFGSASDVFSVEAIITSNSYLLSKDCKLTGGFAFYVWVKGPHEGDFVVTLGGYHPRFNKPDHYPDVPRLGLTWKIGDTLMIRGGMYFALTSRAIMAGGRWEVLFKTSVVCVTIIVWVDMLISWAPFLYDFDIGVLLRIDLYILIHIRLELSAQLHIWGPKFAGIIRVNLTIFSFSIPFGSTEKKAKIYLPWSDFATGFIPKAQTGDSKQSTAEPINITVSNGLLEMRQIDGLDFPVINPGQLAIRIESFIPVTDILLPKGDIHETQPGNIPENITNGQLAFIAADTPTQSTALNTPLKYQDAERNIGVQPCGFKKEETRFFLVFGIRLEGRLIDMNITCLAKGYAESLWAPAPSEDTNQNPGTAKIIPNVLGGLLLQPMPPEIAATPKAFDFSKIYDNPENPALDWHFTRPMTAAAYFSRDVLPKTLATTYQASEEKRKDILAALKKDFDETLTGATGNEMDDIIKIADRYFKAAPILCPLGEIPNTATDTTN